MRKVPEEEILKRLRVDSPWWKNRNDVRWKEYPERVYFTPFFELIYGKKINRAIVLMGPRRVGKTVMVHQAIARLIKKKVPPRRILYVSLDNPLYSGLWLEKILLMFSELNSVKQKERCYVFFDEIQYLSDWERHLKSLVDSYPQHRFIATGSAAAALRLKSNESGAGRFSDFTLPPLTFYEYIRFSDTDKKAPFLREDGSFEEEILERIEDLNDEFINYINFGGYPETVFLEDARENPRFVKDDIIDKVLLRDLPSLYGIQDIAELNRLFVTLAHNTGQEVDLPGISQDSNVSKDTILRYLEYLEAAFLIKRVNRVDRSVRKFKRNHKFKVYLRNASMYPALFGAVDKNDKAVLGRLVETAVFSHFFHVAEYFNPYYASWKNGEIDLIIMDVLGKPLQAIEIKWSDRPLENPSQLRALLSFAEENRLGDSEKLICCTLSKLTSRKYGNRKITFCPTSVFCLLHGQYLESAEFRKALIGPSTEGEN